MDSLMPLISPLNAFGPVGLPFEAGLFSPHPQACQRCCAGAASPLDPAWGMGMGMNPAAGMGEALLFQLVSLLTGLLANQSLAGSQGTSPWSGSQGGGTLGGGSYGGGALGGGGGSPGFDTPGQVVDPSQFKGGTEMGRRLAAAALRESTDGDSQGGWCARDVKAAMREVGLNLPPGDAWKMAEPLAKHPGFREIQVSEAELDRLPPGAVVVWDKTASSPYGHISISLGDGREASDLLRKQLHLRGSRFRVFMPI